MLRLAWLASRFSVHTVRWVNSLAERGHEVHLISMQNGGEPLDSRITFHHLPFGNLPIGYLLNAFPVRGLVRRLAPDILHAHYASGYGTLGRHIRYHPYLLSVWGSDVYDVPSRSRLWRRLVTANLLAADRLCSTSNAMAMHTMSLSPRIEHPAITPFGIDTSQFYPRPQLRNQLYITIGTLKSLSHRYGIDILLRAFATVKTSLQTTHPELASKLRLLVVGGGSDRRSLEELAGKLSISQDTEFVGQISHQDAPKYLNRLDIFVAASRMESFGVAALEACACAIPVVVSDAPGLAEVIDNNRTGIIVRRNNVAETARAIERLVLSPSLREKLSKCGRQHVITEYSWESSVDRMEQVYHNLLRT